MFAFLTVSFVFSSGSHSLYNSLFSSSHTAIFKMGQIHPKMPQLFCNRSKYMWIYKLSIALENHIFGRFFVSSFLLVHTLLFNSALYINLHNGPKWRGKGLFLCVTLTVLLLLSKRKKKAVGTIIIHLCYLKLSFKPLQFIRLFSSIWPYTQRILRFFQLFYRLCAFLFES